MAEWTVGKGASFHDLPTVPQPSPNDGQKTIGYFDESSHLGGTTRYLFHLISGIDRDRYRLVFFAPHARGWHEGLRDAGVEVFTGPPAAPAVHDTAAEILSEPHAPHPLAWSLGLAGEIRSLSRLFRRHRVDLLHSNQAGAEPAPVAARLAGLPRVMATWHVDSTYDLDGLRNGWHYRALEKVCMRSLDHAIAVSKATAADWIMRCGLGDAWWSKVTVIPNGVPTASLARRMPAEQAKSALGLGGRFIIGSAGRLEAAKGYEYLIRSLPGLVRVRPDVLVRIAGQGEFQASLSELARSLGVADRVDFVGFVDDIRGFMESLDIYVQPSLCEAQGLAILEACAVGNPVVASAVGGIPECVQDGETGYLAPPRNPEALTEALIRLAEDPAARVRMAEKGLCEVRKNFDRDRMVSDTLLVYRRLLA
jgi:glycosyltransferase involved in cell wall biosynthesis